MRVLTLAVRGMACAVGACALALSFAAPGGPAACERGSESAQRAHSSTYTIHFELTPEPAVAKHFAVLFTVCRGSGAATPDTVALDARMPSHGHGMNYRPTVAALGSGRFRAEGLMLHMPGEWELVFLLHYAGRSERITHTLVLR